MKRIVIICALLTSAVSFSYSQEGEGNRGGFGQPGGRGAQGGPQVARTPEQRAQTTLDDLLSSFNLNKENRTKALVILVALNKSLDSLNATMPPTTADIALRQAAGRTMQPKRLAIMQANEVQFIALLTEKQKKLYETSIKDRPANRGFGQAGGGGGQGGGGDRGGQGGEGNRGGFGGR